MARATCLLALTALATLVPLPGLADPGLSAWLDLIQDCEAVISDQTLAPLEDREPAPFTMGLPDKKEYSFYDTSQTLVAIARNVDGAWTNCWVRESREADRVRWRELATEWNDAYQAAFSGGTYRLVAWHFGSHSIPRALRCREDADHILVAPFITDFHFRVAVLPATGRKAAELCEGAGEG